MRRYTYAEAAAELRVEKTWLQRHIKELPHSRKGRVVTFTDDDLVRIDQIHHHEPTHGPLARPVLVPSPAGGHPLADLKPLPSRGRKTA
jgi:hypothetical protein